MRHRRVSPLAVALGLWLRAAHATTVTPMTEADLHARAEVVIAGTVTRVASFSTAHRNIETRARIAVDQVLAGRLGRRTIVVHVPGGTIGDATVLIFGSPVFVPGDEVEVALVRRRDGAFTPLGLSLGTRVRHPSSLRAVPSFGVTPAFAFLVHGRPFRWIRGSRPVRMRVATTDPTLGVAATLEAIDASMAAWSTIPAAAIVLERRGSTRPHRSASQNRCDRRNIIQFEDPRGELPDLVGCSGVLGITGICGIGGQRLKITEADVTLNRNLGSCFGDTGVREILAHELGHAIGLGHSSERVRESDFALADATMYFLIHDDGRGPTLRGDDIDGARTLYP